MLKLCVKETEELNAERQRKEQMSRRGRTSKAKGANFERTVASKLKDAYGEDFVRTPLSGGFFRKSETLRGDIVLADKNLDCMLHIEAKNSKTWKLPEWIKQSQNDCPQGKISCVVFHQHRTSNDFIALSLEDFFKIVPKENIIGKAVPP